MTMLITLAPAAYGSANPQLVKEMLMSLFNCQVESLNIVEVPTQPGEHLNIAMDGTTANIKKEVKKRIKLNREEETALYLQTVRLFEEFEALNMFALQKKLSGFQKAPITRVIRTLMAEGFIRKEGQKRATTYFKIDGAKSSAPFGSVKAHA